VFKLELDESEIISPERKLWRAVLSLAFIDALCQNESKVTSVLKSKAHRWFLYGGRDFDDVCHLAGFTGPFVRRKYEKLMKERAIKFSDKQSKLIFKYWADLEKRKK